MSPTAWLSPTTAALILAATAACRPAPNTPPPPGPRRATETSPRRGPQPELRRLLALEKRRPLSRQQARRLAHALRLRARELAAIQMPAAAAADLRHAQKLAPISAGSPGSTLRQTLDLALADRALFVGRSKPAIAAFEALAGRGRISGNALAWRRLASGKKQPATLLAWRRAVTVLARRAPGPGAILTGRYLEQGGQDPATLLAGLRATLAAGDGAQLARLDKALATHAPLPLLARACDLDGRFGRALSCRKLQARASHAAAARRHWLSLCQRRRWPPGVALGKRQSVPPGATLPALLGWASRWATGPRGEGSGPRPACLADTYRRAGAFPPAYALTRDSAGRKALDSVLLQWRRLSAAFGVGARVAKAIEARWRLHYGVDLTAALPKPRPSAVAAGPTTALQTSLMTAVKGRLSKALQHLRTRPWSPSRQRWLARLAALGGEPKRAESLLLALSESSPGGLAHLPAAVTDLIALGRGAAAARLLRPYYESGAQDPALLWLIAWSDIAAGRASRARLAIIDLAARSPRPAAMLHRAALAWLEYGKPQRAAALLRRAIPFAGPLPETVGADLVDALARAGQPRAARSALAWLLDHWPHPAEQAAIKRRLVRRWAGTPTGRLLTRELGPAPKTPASLLAEAKAAAALKAALALGRRTPHNGSAAVAVAGLALRARRPTLAATWVRRAGLLRPELAPLLRALQAAATDLEQALGELALALAVAPRAWRRFLGELAATFASEHGDRVHAARLLGVTWQLAGAQPPAAHAVAQLKLLRLGQRLSRQVPWTMLLQWQLDDPNCRR